MQNFFQGVELKLNHVQVMVRGMYAVAKSDDELHQAELVMLRAFYETCRDEVEGLASFTDLVSVPFDADEAAEVLSSEELKHTFLKSCVLLGFADGVYSGPEKDVVAKLAVALGVSDESLATIQEQVRDVLLRQFAHLGNVEALAELARELT